MLPDIFLHPLSHCVLSGIVIFIFIIHRPCRTIHNLMICNASTTAILFTSLELVCAGFALQKDWLTCQPVCMFRAYLYNTFR